MSFPWEKSLTVFDKILKYFFVCKMLSALSMWLMRARLFLLQKAWQINEGVFLSEHEAACVEATLIQSHGEQSANRGLMTAPRRPEWPLNLPEAPPPPEGIY